MTDCTVKYGDLDACERINRALIAAGDNADTRWEASVALLNFLDEHPTFLAFLIAAGRSQFEARRQNPITPPFGNAEEQV
jgi:hypothetical protein